jgi:glycogen(starch) synthase
MRICIATRPYRPVNGGYGIGSMMASLAPEWHTQGHDITVLTIDAAVDEQIIDGVHVMNVRQYEPQAIRWPLAFAQMVRRHGPFDVVFAPEYDGCMALYSLRQSSGPLMTTLASSHEQVAIMGESTRVPLKEATRLRYIRFIERLQTAHSAAVFAPSAAPLDWNLRDGWSLPESRHIIGNPVDVDVVQAAARGPRPEWLPEGSVIVCVGRVERLKGARELFGAMPAIRHQVPDAQLVMIGEVKQRLEASARTVPGVTLAGPRPLTEVASALGHADVAVFPSYWETFGIAAMEAMAAGASTVLTSGSGFEEFAVHEQNSLVVPPRDVDALAGAVLRLLEDDVLRRKLGAASRETAAQFAAPLIAHRYIEAFEAVLSPHRAMASVGPW